MKTIYFLVPFCFLILTGITTQAQIKIGKILDKTVDRTVDKIGRKAEYIVVEKTSEALARKAVRPLDKAVNNMLYSSYRKEYGDQYTDEEIDSIINSSGGAFDAYLASMNKAADVPPVYIFDVVQELETRDYDKEKNKMNMMYSTKEAIFGIRQFEKNKETVVILDSERNIMVTYTDMDGKIKGQAIPSEIINSAASYSQANYQSDKNQPPDFHPIKDKKIAGYNCRGFESENEKEYFKGYFSNEVPVSLTKAVGGFVQKFTPKMYDESYKDFDGILMEYESKNKDSGEKSEVKTKKIRQENEVHDMTKVDFERRH